MDGEIKTTTTPQKKKFKVRTSPHLLSAEKVLQSGELTTEDAMVRALQEAQTPSCKTHGIQRAVKRVASAEHDHGKAFANDTEQQEYLDGTSDDQENDFNRRAFGFDASHDFSATHNAKSIKTTPS